MFFARSVPSTAIIRLSSKRESHTSSIWWYCSPRRKPRHRSDHLQNKSVHPPAAFTYAHGNCSCRTSLSRSSPGRCPRQSRCFFVPGNQLLPYQGLSTSRDGGLLLCIHDRARMLGMQERTYFPSKHLGAMQRASFPTYSFHWIALLLRALNQVKFGQDYTRLQGDNRK